MTTTVPRLRKGRPDLLSGGRLAGRLRADSLRLLEKSLKRQWRRYRKELKRCQARFSEKTIHDCRVGARRLLSTVELLSGFVSPSRVRKVERALKTHLGTFDGLRDTQVQLPLIEKLQRRFPAARHFYGFLEKRESRLIKSTRRNIKKVGTQRLERLMADCREEIHARRKKCPPEKTVYLVLESVNRAFAAAGRLRARIDGNDTDVIHRARVAFKKFRYMVETLAPCLPAPVTKLLSAMRHYQTTMGLIQDIEVLRLAFEKFLRKKRLGAEPAGRLRQELLLRRRRLIESYMNITDQMLRFWPLDGPAPGRAIPASRKPTSLAL